MLELNNSPQTIINSRLIKAKELLNLSDDEFKGIKLALKEMTNNQK